MVLTVTERKEGMPRGARRQVAVSCNVDPSYVTKAMNDEVFPKTELGRQTLRRVQVAIARKLRKPVDMVFPPLETRQETSPMASVP